MPFKWKQTPKSPTYLLGFGEQKLTCTLQIPLGLNLQYHYLSLADTNPLQRNRISPSWLFEAILCPLLSAYPHPPALPLFVPSLLVLPCHYETLLYLKCSKQKNSFLKHRKLLFCMVLLTSLPTHM